MRDERRLRGLASIHGVATAASTAARIKNVWRVVILKALARPLSPGEIPDPPSSIDILSVGHHARESALVVGQPDAPPLQLLPKDAVLRSVRKIGPGSGGAVVPQYPAQPLLASNAG